MSTLLRFLLGATLAVGAANAQARIERVIEKTFPVSGKGILRLESHGGEIRVVPSDEPNVKVRARQRIAANTDAEADELLQRLEFSLEQSGNDVTGIARYPRSKLPNWRTWPPVRVDFEVSVPSEFATRLETSGGTITLGDLRGPVTARTSGGKIKAGRVGGPVEARTSGGDISIAEAGGAVNLRTSGGDIEVGRVAGTAEVSTSGGDITVEAATGSLQAHTSGGTIRASIQGPVTGDCSLSSSGGGIRLTVDSASAYRLDASSSGGAVDARGLKMEIEQVGARSKLVGAVNGGGPALKLRSSGGGITLRTR